MTEVLTIEQIDSLVASKSITEQAAKKLRASLNDATAGAVAATDSLKARNDAARAEVEAARAAGKVTTLEPAGKPAMIRVSGDVVFLVATQSIVGPDKTPTQYRSARVGLLQKGSATRLEPKTWPALAIQALGDPDVQERISNAVDALDKRDSRGSYAPKGAEAVASRAVLDADEY